MENYLIELNKIFNLYIVLSECSDRRSIAVCYLFCSFGKHRE